MESLLPKNDQVCSTVTPAKRQRTITNVTDRNKQGSFTKLMGIAYELALKPNWYLLDKGFKFQSRLVFSRFLDLGRNLGKVKEKPIRKTCFTREKKRLDLLIFQAKFALEAIL